MAISFSLMQTIWRACLSLEISRVWRTLFLGLVLTQQQFIATIPSLMGNFMHLLYFCCAVYLLLSTHPYWRVMTTEIWTHLSVLVKNRCSPNLNDKQFKFYKQMNITNLSVTCLGGPILESSKYNFIPVSLWIMDLEKAFDSVRHGAIFEALKHKGASPILINYVKFIYRNSRTDPVAPYRGVRLGDPLSPLPI